jgi:hypothetical protein
MAIRLVNKDDNLPLAVRQQMEKAIRKLSNSGDPEKDRTPKKPARKPFTEQKTITAAERVEACREAHSGKLFDQHGQECELVVCSVSLGI